MYQSVYQSVYQSISQSTNPSVQPTQIESEGGLCGRRRLEAGDARHDAVGEADDRLRAGEERPDVREVHQQPHLLQIDALAAAVGAGDQRHVLVAVAEGVVGDEGA